MEFLSSWLKSIILVILMATFIDLLLPNHTMQRYVKTVVSLFILLTLLHPLFTLFEKNTQVDEMLAVTLFKQQNLNGGQTAAVSGQAESLPVIRQQAEELKQRQEQQAHRLVQQQAAELMKRSIEQQVGVKVGQVHVETKNDASGNKVISTVNVQLNAEVKLEEKGRKPSSMVSSEPIRPVQPVQIQVNSEARPAAKPAEPQNTANPAPELDQKRTQVVLLLRQEWQLQDQQVSVQWLGSDHKVKQ